MWDFYSSVQVWEVRLDVSVNSSMLANISPASLSAAENFQGQIRYFTCVKDQQNDTVITTERP